MGTCLPCAAGSFMNVSGQSACLECPAGFVCAAQATAAVPCKGGTFGGSSGLRGVSDCEDADSSGVRCIELAALKQLRPRPYTRTQFLRKGFCLALKGPNRFLTEHHREKQFKPQHEKGGASTQV